MLKVTGLVLFFIITIFTCNAQVHAKRHLKKGRRNKSQHQLTLVKNTFQADFEFGYETVNDTVSTFVYPNLALRYGVSDNFEVNLEVNPITTFQKSNVIKSSTPGIEPVLFGVRFALVSETKFIPEMAISAQIAPPHLATSNYQAVYWAPIIQYSLQKNINKHIVVAASAGVFFDGFSTEPIWLYELGPTWNISSTFSVGADFFGYAEKHVLPLNNIDLNASFQVSKLLSLGIIAGTGVSSAAHKSYFAINGSFIIFQPKEKNVN